MNSKPRVSILMYHQVGFFRRPAAHRATFCHVRRFRRQMAWLKRSGYHVIRLTEAVRGLKGEIPLPNHSVVLTFDDGYRNFYENAYPMLHEYGFPATVFMVAGHLGSTARWIEEEGRFGAPLMEKDHLLEIQAGGIEIGSHTVTHPRLSKIPLSKAQREIAESKSILESLLGDRVIHFCYPYGDFNPQIADLVQEAGYESALTCIRGAATAEDSLFCLPRKAVSYGDSLIGYLWKLHIKNKKKAPTSGPKAPFTSSAADSTAERTDST
ncbi:polysaccharide deacetylase family protein [Desulfoglaeba alkanexedens ALDC]|uniref:Polysaccharide deacetylase family protein n=2 Tax=Desulfoglaeba alkanexedens TaxID=361111 RepID=A0A4P8L014_9BACT|nr:polysaccharide deacetylase family protein [Desulfoglaeba alkanexedens ALDC]